MDEAKIGMMSAENMGRETLQFVRRVMRDPERRKQVEELAKQLDAQEKKQEI